MPIMTYQAGPHEYEVCENWAKLPKSLNVDQVCAVTVGKSDHVFILNRGDNPVIELDPEGNVVKPWDFAMADPHGIHADSKGNIYLADRGTHLITKHDVSGTLLMTLGTKNKPSDTGYEKGGEHVPVMRSAEPFNAPAGIAVADNGQIFVADGYGNARIHKFSAEGELLLSWGKPGRTEPGAFNLVHGIGFNKEGNLLICDRENHRMQVFNQDGKHLATWTGFQQPMDVIVDSDGTIFIPELPSRISVVDSTGKILNRWGGTRSTDPGGFTEVHGIAMDSSGNIYVGEVTENGRIQKFARV